MTTVNEQIEHTLKLAEKHGLRLKRKHAEINESGMDFQVVFAEDEAGKSWVLRKPRRDDVIERAVYEGKVLKPAAKPSSRGCAGLAHSYSRTDCISGASGCACRSH